MAVRLTEFIAIVLMALALIPSGAHFFALPNKIGLSRDAYFVTQQIYAGWALFGIVLFSALTADIVLAWLRRGDRSAMLLAALGGVSIVVMLAIFFTWTFPANQATVNWTEVSPDWETLRRNWEYSHAANAVITFAGFCCVVLSALVARR